MRLTIIAIGIILFLMLAGCVDDNNPPLKTITCNKIFFDGTENLTCDVLIISDEYTNEIHCRSMTVDTVNFIYHNVGKMEETK